MELPARPPDVATEVKSVAMRQHDIEDDQIEGQMSRLIEP